MQTTAHASSGRARAPTLSLFGFIRFKFARCTAHKVCATQIQSHNILLFYRGWELATVAKMSHQHLQPVASLMHRIIDTQPPLARTPATGLNNITSQTTVIYCFRREFGTFYIPALNTFWKLYISRESTWGYFTLSHWHILDSKDWCHANAGCS